MTFRVQHLRHLHCRFRLACLALAAGLVLAIPAVAATDEGQEFRAPSVTGSNSTAAARALINRGRYDEALAILRPLAERNGTAGTNARFLTGLAAIGAAQKPDAEEDARNRLLDEAIDAFRAILVDRPDLVRVRLELARAFFLKREDKLAARHFQQVFAGSPPAPVVLNVNRFLAQIRARKRWSLHVGFALAPDTNIGAGSDEEIIYIHGLPFRRDAQELTTSGIGLSAWAGGEYQQPLADRWRLRAGGDVAIREYKESRFDRTTIAGHLGPRWLIDRNTEASALASARKHWIGGEPDHQDLGLRLEARHRLDRRTTASLRTSWHERSYDRQEHLDGPTADISLAGRHALTPTVLADASFGWGYEKPETERYRHKRYWLQAGVTVDLPGGFTVGGSGTLRWANYEGNWFPFTTTGASRNDITRSLRLSAYNRAFSFEGFSPQVSLVREDRTSNAQLYGYERTSGELRFVRLF